MKKPIVLATLILVLLISMALHPLVKAITTYNWDSVRFAEGGVIHYPHPYRDYYEISPYSDWEKKGYYLYHYQINQPTSTVIQNIAAAIGGFIGAVIGGKIVGVWGAVLGFAVGEALGIAISYYVNVVFLDEAGCIWFWISIAFADWLSALAPYLGPLCVTNPEQAQDAIMDALLQYGYVRVGSQTYIDAIGMGNPAPSETGGSGGETCPTLLVWDGTDYVDYGVIDIHNPTGEDVIREVSILEEDVGVNSYKAKFSLREGWEGLNFSESVIDQVKLCVTDSYGNRYLCPLISAQHSRLGNVLPKLTFSDDLKVQILLLETIDLTFVVPYQNVQGYTFVIEGCNMYKQ